MTAAKQVLRYLKTTKRTKLELNMNQDTALTTYADATFMDGPEDSKSTTGYAIWIGNSLISWNSKKQTRIAKSVCQAEWMALCDAASELLLLKNLLQQLHMEVHEPIIAYNINT